MVPGDFCMVPGGCCVDLCGPRQRFCGSRCVFVQSSRAFVQSPTETGDGASDFQEDRRGKLCETMRGAAMRKTLPGKL